MDIQIIYLKYIKHCNLDRHIKAIVLIPILLLPYSCKKLVETPPPSGSITETNVFSSDGAAIGVLNGLYSVMNTSGQPVQGRNSISLYAGLSADELTLNSAITTGSYFFYYQNALSAVKGFGSDLWAPLYNNVFKCNAAIEGLTSTKADGLTTVVKQQLLGEAKFMRAFFYFYLVNLFGDIPLCITTDPEINTQLARSSKEDVYKKIIADLQEAEEILSNGYLNSFLTGLSTERVRPIKWAATALLARVYLYTRDFVNAEAKANDVIDNSLYELLPDLNTVFLKNSRETIWQLQPTAINFNTTEAQTLVLPIAGPNTTSNPVYLSNNLINSFDANDLRAKYKNWIDTVRVSGTLYRFPYKYKLNLTDATITSETGVTNIQEYFMMLRLGEQYLIRAEARAKQVNLTGAKADLNAIRARANLSPVTTNDQSVLLAAIWHERQLELFTEWGHRWLDIKRTGKVEEIMNSVTPLKAGGAPWESFQQFYPLPKISDLDKAPNLEQNKGY